MLMLFLQNILILIFNWKMCIIVKKQLNCENQHHQRVFLLRNIFFLLLFVYLFIYFLNKSKYSSSTQRPTITRRAATRTALKLDKSQVKFQFFKHLFERNKNKIFFFSIFTIKKMFRLPMRCEEIVLIRRISRQWHVQQRKW